MKNLTLVKRTTVFAAFAFLFSCSQPTDPSIVRQNKYKEPITEAYQKVGLFCAANQVPGLTVAVSVNNQLVWADGFGSSNLEFKVKAMPDHKFRIGQLTELITGLTAAKLYEQGRLDIDKPVSYYLPDLDPVTEHFTFRQLAAHTAGIQKEKSLAGTEYMPVKNMIDSFIHDNLDFPPGQFYRHTQLGYDLMGYIIQKIENKPYSKIVKSILLDTLKLSNTVPDNPFSIFDKKSSTYESDYMAQQVVASAIDLRGKEASVGYLSSVTDLVKMGNAVLYPGFLQQKTLDMMTTPYKLGSGMTGVYGFGLISANDGQNRHFYGLQGSVTGGCAALLIYPDDKMVIAMTSNIGDETMELPIFEIAGIFRKHIHPELEKKENQGENGTQDASGNKKQ